MPLDLIQQYASFKQRAKEQLKKAISERAALDKEITALEAILGEIGSVKTPKMKWPKASGMIMPTAKRGRRKRSRRSPEQLKEWASTAIQAVKAAKGGAKKGDVEKAIGEKLPQLWVALVEKHSGQKLRRTGDKSTARYFAK